MKGRELIAAVEAALGQLGDAVTLEERQQFEGLAAEVGAQLAAPLHDVAGLKAANQALDEATQELAVRLLDQAMEAALRRRGLVDG